MTIKEAETRTGLARANIRYYEDQGFFSAQRGENGYRDYSEENIDTLLKVKLLRQLGFSLDEIRALQKGEQSLGPALERREAGLEREQRELGQAIALCRDMRSDGADFCTLDARRYLIRLAQAEALEKDRDPVRIFPWRRYFARELDLAIYGTVLALILQVCFKMNYLRISEDSGRNMLLALAGLLVMAGAETLMLHFWGTTPGKWLLGLKLLREDGTRFSLTEAARRTGMVTAFSGIYFLLIASKVPLFGVAGMVPLAWAMWQAYHGNPLFWEPDNQVYLDGSDRYKAFWEKKRGWYGLAGYLAAWAVCFGLTVGGHYLASMPPHRGPELTAEQFVENYNQCMAFVYGEENLSRRLAADGTFQEIETPGVVVIHVFGDGGPIPEEAFRFTQEDGRLTGVALVQRYESSGPFTEEEENYTAFVPYDEIYVAMRSFLWRQLGNKGVSDLHDALIKQGGTLHRALDGAQIDSEMHFSGYDAWGDSTLFPQEGMPQRYSVEFSMTLTE